MKIHVLHTGEVCVSPYLPFGGENCNLIKASGISLDKEKQKKSLEWIRQQSMDENCLESLANHDPDVVPHIILL